MITPPRFISAGVVLAGHTTIGLGGMARWFASCESMDALSTSLAFARKAGLPVQVIAGGSNVIFADEGYDGLIIKVNLRGVRSEETANGVIVAAAAGEVWDAIVGQAVEQGWGGIECLSGIPGSAGATPIQNVGAYGQEVGETIIALRALDRRTLTEREFQGAECGFGYRQSRFKEADRDCFIVTEVRFRFRKNAREDIRYPELAIAIGETADLRSLQSGRPVLNAVRNTVLALRRKKSMVVDPSDENSRSIGSFFMNPVLTEECMRSVQERWLLHGDGTPVPAYPGPKGVKLPAGWLVEKSGFPRGYRKGGAGLSAHHALAIVNRGGSTHDVLSLAADIEKRVSEKFGIQLRREPVIVPYSPHA